MITIQSPRFPCKVESAPTFRPRLISRNQLHAETFPFIRKDESRKRYFLIGHPLSASTLYRCCFNSNEYPRVLLFSPFLTSYWFAENVRRIITKIWKEKTSPSVWKVRGRGGAEGNCELVYLRGKFNIRSRDKDRVAVVVTVIDSILVLLRLSVVPPTRSVI